MDYSIAYWDLPSFLPKLKIGDQHLLGAYIGIEDDLIYSN